MPGRDDMMAEQDVTAGALWDAGPARSNGVERGLSWTDALETARSGDPGGPQALIDAVDGVLRQAGTMRALMAKATEAAEAKAAAAESERDDAKDTLDAWFERSALVGEATGKAIHDSVAGYLRTSRVGGMSRKDSDMVQGVVDDMCRQGRFSDVLMRAAEVPHKGGLTLPTPRAIPNAREAVFLLLDECKSPDPDPDDGAAIATKAEALALLKAASQPFKVPDDVAQVRDLLRAVAVARFAPAGPAGARIVMERLVRLVHDIGIALEPREPERDGNASSPRMG